MICPKCEFEQEDKITECLKCGIIFEKYKRHKNINLETNTPIDTTIIEINDQEIKFIDFAKELLFFVEAEISPVNWGGRIIFFLIIFIWGCKFILTPLENNYAGNCFLHLVNLPFHETGHIIFRPFGHIIMSLGGSLAQLIMPLICLVVFLIKTRDPFAASVCLWWFGENFMDIAPYMNDARDLTLPLLGGNTGMTSPYGFHDWEFIFTELGLLQYDHLLASITQILGIILMIVSFVWSVYLIVKQYKNLVKHI
ncbi:MAG: zinc ribbon domain-containing protein [Desulfobacterales bacterium]|nr:zinc ribbon domain-containing protein [Desulfobacterales bacterium]